MVKKPYVYVTSGGLKNRLIERVKTLLIFLNLKRITRVSL